MLETHTQVVGTYSKNDVWKSHLFAKFTQGAAKVDVLFLQILDRAHADQGGRYNVVRTVCGYGMHVYTRVMGRGKNNTSTHEQRSDI